LVEGESCLLGRKKVNSTPNVKRITGGRGDIFSPITTSEHFLALFYIKKCSPKLHKFKRKKARIFIAQEVAQKKHVCKHFNLDIFFTCHHF